MFNQAFAKRKSWELRFYQRARRNASKKNSPRIEPGRLQVNTASPEDDELAGKAAFIWQRVEPPSNRCGVPKGQRVPPGFANAFGASRSTRQLELFALLSFR